MNREVWESLKELGKERFISMNITLSIILIVPLYVGGKTFFDFEAFSGSIWIDLLLILVGAVLLSYFFSHRFWVINEKKFEKSAN